MNRTRSRALALTTAPLALGMAVALVAAPAQASSTSKKDPAGDHVTGSGATLDLAKVSMRTKGKKKIQVTFNLHNDVTAEHLALPGAMGVNFDVEKKIMRSVQVFARDGVIQSNVCTYDTRKEELPPPTKCNPLALTQVDAKTFRVELKRNQVKKGAKVLKWRASAFQAAGAALDPLGSAKKPFAWKL